MHKKFLSLALVATLFSMTTFVQPAPASTQTNKEAQHATKVKAGVAKVGTGAQARISLKLRDNTKLKGYVSQAGENDFVITDSQTGASRTVAYSDVMQIRGKGLSTGAKVAIGVGIGVGALIAIVAFALRDFDPLGGMF